MADGRDTPPAAAPEPKPAEARKADARKAEVRKAEGGKADRAKAEARKADARKAEAGKAEDSKAEAAKRESRKPEAGSADARPADPRQRDAKPAEGKAEAKAEPKPAEAKAPDEKPAEPKPASTKPADPKPADAKPVAAKPAPPAGKPAAQPKPVAEVAAPATPRRRHWMVLASFIVVVLLPSLVALWYLYSRAEDQYASVMAFSVRSEETRSALDVLGRLGGAFGGGGGGGRDAEVLYQFIQSQELVARIDQRLDLRSLFSRHYATDPVFGFRPDGTIEDLTNHWSRMLRIAFDGGTGLMEIRVLAFDPQEAKDIALAILDESTRRINELSAIAREDATRNAREDLDVAVERLRQAREAMTQFRIRTRIVDPSADIQGQMGLLNTLQAQLAAALIELDLLRETTRETDPRITQAERRIEVIRVRIEEERGRFGGGQGPGGEDYATVMAEFERLNVDREFAEQAYRSAMSAYDAAVAEAQRTSRYLAAHITPTLAESARYPERATLAALTVFFLLIAWAVAVLISYSIRDSR